MEKINIAEILRDCPKGMELYSPLCGKCVFDRVNFGTIICKKQNTQEITFTSKGYYMLPVFDDCECMIFPSKDQRDWSKFQRPFMDGDILISGLNSCEGNPFIFKQLNSFGNAECYCAINCYGELIFNSDNWTCIKGCRLATFKEKEKLFNTINEKGYKWNEETKTLEKLTVPSTPEKFYIRIGDIPSEEKSSVHRGDVVVGYEDGVSVYDCVETDGLYRIVMPFPLKEGQGMTYECLIQEITQCRYEIENPRNVYLVSGIEVGKGHDNEPLIKNVKILKDLTEQFNTKNDNTEETKTLEKLVDPKFKVGDRVKKKDSNEDVVLITDIANNYYIVETKYGMETTISISIQNDYELVPNKFDITTLKPFDKVLVRSHNSDVWECDFFSLYNPECSNRFHCVGAWYDICIPYIGNEHLRGTTNDCDEYYKTYENTK